MLELALQDTVPALLALLDALPEDSPFRQLDPPRRRQRTLDALRHLLLRESQVQPVLLVVEDLHWIDAETQALLDSLVESLPTAQLLLLVNYHAEYQHGWGSKTYYTQLRLDPLLPASAEAVLAALLGDDLNLAPLTPLLIARTEGNPFFLEESVRTLVETEVLVGTPGAYRLVQPLQGMPVPATVQAVLAARIDRLPPEDKRLLQTAAVIGTDVPLPLLQAIADVPEAVLHRGLAHLQAAEFLYETRLFPEPEYTFKHALTHEVAYSSLLPERRRGLHARIVEALEVLAGEQVAEQVERLAHHAFRGEVWGKALSYLRQAGARALWPSAYREAIAWFEQALEALQYLPESQETREQAVDVRLDLSRALHFLGERERVLAYLNEAEPLAEALRDRRRLGQVLAFMANAFLMVGDAPRALTASRRALASGADLGDIGLQAIASFCLGEAYHALGEYRQAIEVLRGNLQLLQGVPRFERFGMGTIVAVAAGTWLAWGLAEQGAFAEGLTSGDEALQIAEAADHPLSVVTASFGVGLLSLRKGDPPKAIPVLERGLRLCQDLEIGGWFVDVAPVLGAAYLQSGRLAGALPLLERAVERAVSIRHIFWQALRESWLSEAYLLSGRVEKALRLAEQALKHAQDRQERGYQAWILRLLGEIHAQQDSLAVAQAETSYRQALARAEALGMRPLQAHCHLGLGMLYAKIGRREEAHAELSEAIALYRTMDMTFWLPQAEAALVEVEGG